MRERTLKSVFLYIFLGLLPWLASDVVSAQETQAVAPLEAPANPAGGVPSTPTRIVSFDIQGNTLIGSDEIYAVIAPLIPTFRNGGETTLVQLQKVADAVTDLYRQRGYFLAKAYIPEQEVGAGGTLQVAVLEGAIGEVKVEGNQFYSSPFIQNHFARLQARNAVHGRSLERSLLLLNDYPDLKATGVLHAGSTPGTTDLVVQVQDRRPLHLSLDYNNFGSKLVGKHQYGLKLSGGNLLGEGSDFSLHGVVGSESAKQPYWGASWGIPVGSDGTRVNLAYSKGIFDVGGELAALGITSETETWGVAAVHPFKKSQISNLTVELGLDGKDARQFLFGSVPLSDDKTRLIRAGLNYDWMNATSKNIVAFSLSHGLGDIRHGAPTPSRFGADNLFDKGVLQAMRFQRFTDAISLVMRGVGQVSTDALVVGEQFVLGGPNSVRGYRAGEFLGDNGYSLHAEARVAPFDDKGFFQMAFFVDQGEAFLKNAPDGVVDDVALSGAGFGLHLNLPYAPQSKNLHKNFSLRMEMGYPFRDGPITKDRPVYYVSLVASL